MTAHTMARRRRAGNAVPLLAPSRPVYWPTFQKRLRASESLDMARDSGPQNVVALAAGFGIGILRVVFAITCLISAMRGFAHDRSDWGLLWGLVGVLLLAAGIAAMVGTWWHQTRVLAEADH
jgi:hypothetical protein